MRQYFHKQYKSFDENVNVEANYATKTISKNGTGIDTSNFALKSNLANLKAEVDKIDVEKLKTIPFDLSKLCNVVDNDLV